MTLIDTFMFAGEADMLYFRLEHLAGKVDRHVIAEADQTHLGVPRRPWIPFHLHCCLEPYQDRITYVPVTYPHAMAPWDREHYQRDKLWEGVSDPATLKSDDQVLICDVDEIPSDAALAAEIPARPGAVSLRMRTFHSAVDWEYEHPELTAVKVLASRILRPHGTLSKIRDSRYSLPVVEDGGWHFTWVGSQAWRERKLAERTCHGDEMPEAEAVNIRTGATWRSGVHDGTQVKPVEVDDTWPAYIVREKCPPSWFRPRW